MRKWFIAVPILLVIVIYAFVWGPWASKPKSQNRTIARKLEKVHAEYRAQRIDRLQYLLKLDITKADKFSGSVKMDFEMPEASELTVDFSSGTVSRVTVNGRVVDDILYNNFFITLPGRYFESGKNSIEVQFEHAYGKTGTGLYRFVDPVDQNVYLYSDFEPYDANEMFPCFDQPDIKGTYQSVITAPVGWEVISTTMETGHQKTPAGNAEEWTFPESKKISTYVFSLHAGNYKIWTSTAQTRIHGIPLRLFARQSIVGSVDPEEWFTTTQQGLLFFEEYFDFPYPYKKYDQVIVPDFNSGAMENVAAVTFNESRFISRSQKTRMEKRKLAGVILHEMGHMWFGDLVTMKWWNDIWLNESFATYIANRALVAATPYTDAWVDFSAVEKSRAYFEDQLVTTHPIEFAVADTDVVFANFDGITYAKGASVIKQLAFLLGEEIFQKGMQDYFKLYSYQNTTLEEFINELQSRARKVDLDYWQKLWLRTAQVNTIKVEYKCEDNKVTAAVLRQTAPADYPAIRPHKTVIGAFLKVKNKLVMQEPIEFFYAAAEQPIPQLDGLDCKALALIYPNMQDQDYVKVELDEKSLHTAKDSISQFEDSLLRAGLWASLWDMVESQKISIQQYVEIFLKNSATEKDINVLRVSLEKIISQKNKFTLKYYLPEEDAWKTSRTKIVNDLSAKFLKSAQQSGDVDAQKLWFDIFVEFAESEKDLQFLQSALNKRPAGLKFDIDQDRRWKIIKALNGKAFGASKALLAAEQVKDSSDRGLHGALAAEVSQPDLEVKKQHWARVIQGPTAEYPLAKLRTIIENIFPLDQSALQEEFRSDFFKTIQDQSAKPGEFLAYFASLTPSRCATESVNEVKDFAEKNKGLSPTLLKRLKIQAQIAERCVAIQAKVKAL